MLLTVAYANVIFASFGLYIWEVFQTSDFEWSIIERKRKLKLQMVCRKPLPVVGDLTSNILHTEYAYIYSTRMLVVELTAVSSPLLHRSLPRNLLDLIAVRGCVSRR